ncbi:efflux RND transporter periplasmic adaptor subunit [Ottowia beijingensis]|uniref:efflux RND transporter periplasmic adaptor subunit n=1 Tax=Ottowia beijingensis TaxID=1207057 RepID=UPI002FD88AE7
MPDHPAIRRLSPRRLLPVGAAVLLAAALAACGNKNDQAAGPGGPGGAMPPPEVGVVTVQPGTVSLSTELPGRLEPSRVAQVRARATGILTKRVFTEGSDVRAGQVLYHVDPAPYQAAQQSAQAQLAQAQASLANASALVARFRPLVAANAVSKQEFDAAVAAEKAAQAQVAAGRAAVRTASINLGYATVTAPISGRIGRSLVTEGALVSAQEGTQLAVIQQTNPLYVNLTQSAGDVLQLRQALQSGQLARSGTNAARVQILLENGQPYAEAGRLLFTDLTVDPGTGQVSLRAEVPNPQQLLLPGMYVRVRLQQAQVENAILLPQQAITRGTPQGDVATVVAADGSFTRRPVTLGEAQGNQWIILGGLQPGEQVMVDGFMKLMPGVKTVKPVPYKPNQAPAQAGQAPAAPKLGASSSVAPAQAAASAAASGPAAAASR